MSTLFVGLSERAWVTFWSDVDVVFLRDPWPAFRHSLACDYEFQCNHEDIRNATHYVSGKPFQDGGKAPRKAERNKGQARSTP